MGAVVGGEIGGGRASHGLTAALWIEDGEAAMEKEQIDVGVITRLNRGAQESGAVGSAMAKQFADACFNGRWHPVSG